MGKKGKGNKLAKMSEEERIRYLQLRADIEEEARRRKIQLISLYMKNKLKREEAFCRLNTAKINQEWRSILRQIKCDDMYKEMEELSRFCNEVLNRKERIISRLLKDMDIAEDMYSSLQYSHMETINKLIENQKSRLNFFKDNYEEEKKVALHNFKEDFTNFKKTSERGRNDLECVAYQLADQSEASKKSRENNFIDKLNYVKSELQIRIEKITSEGELKLQTIWDEYQNVLSGYVKHTEGFYTEYIDLKERDDENTQQIREHCVDIERMTNYLAHLKIAAADAQDEHDGHIKYLTSARNQLNERLIEFKTEINRQIKQEEERFKFMTVVSHNAIKTMRNILAKGEILMQLQNVCAKLETDTEKTSIQLPFIQTGYNDNEAKMTKKQNCEINDDDISEDEFLNFDLTEKFWKRVNNVKIDVICLKERKKELQEENYTLKKELEEHLLKLNLSNGCNQHVNDTLLSRPHSMIVGRVTKCEMDMDNSFGRNQSERRPTTSIVEANFSSAVRSQQLQIGKAKLAKINAKHGW